MILTKPGYWNSISPSTKAYWQNVANGIRGARICTHRPDINQFGKKADNADMLVRRCSTGGKYGKSVDLKWLSEQTLMDDGYIYVTYISVAERAVIVEQKREEVYSNDCH